MTYKALIRAKGAVKRVRTQLKKGRGPIYSIPEKPLKPAPPKKTLPQKGKPTVPSPQAGKTLARIWDVNKRKWRTIPVKRTRPKAGERKYRIA